MNRRYEDSSWELEGRFWLPGSDDRRYGRVQWSVGHDLVLGIPEGPLVEVDLESREVPVSAVIGEALGPLPFPMSLLDGAAMLPRTVPLVGGDRTALVFSTLVRGTHVTSASDLTGTFARVGIHRLDDFLLGGKADEQAVLHVTADQPAKDRLVVEMPWGTITLWADSETAHRKGRGRAVTHRVATWAQFEFKTQIALTDVDRHVQPLVDLVAFATRRCSAVTSLRIHGPRPDDGGLDRGDYEVVRPRQDALEDGDERPPSYLLLNLGYVDDPAAAIRGWYELRDRVGDVWPLFFATAIPPVSAAEPMLVNLTTFAEGYHRQVHDRPPISKRRAQAAVKTMLAALEPDDELVVHYKQRLAFTEQQTQRQRLRDLTDNALALLDIWDLAVDEFMGQVVQTRNWLTHWGKRGSKVQEGDALQLLNSRLYTVLVANILVDCGIPQHDVLDTLGSGLRGLGLP